MPINVPPQKNVNPGEPVTAEGWNALTGSITALTNYLNSTEASGARVQVKNAGVLARVSASRDDGAVFDAVSPVSPGTDYVFSSLRPGGYTLRVEAAGFAVFTAAMTVPVTTPVEVSLTPSGAFMPPLFGLPLRSALQELGALSIKVGRILDVVGRDIPPANPGSDYTDQPVLMQLPAAGVAVPVDGEAQLVVATTLQVQPSVEMPSLAGLTFSEAQKALEAIGLVLGKVDNKS